MLNVEGKRLLLMGATSMMATAVETAKRMGVYTIVADYNQDSPAKRIADKAYLVSTADTEALLNICREEHVDGVFFGYSELNQYFTLDLTERGGYYNYATRQQVDTLANKANFKACCRKYGVPTVPEYSLSKELRREELDALQYPVIVKPVDSFSGKGITICTCEDEVRYAVPLAVQASRTGGFLVEKYMTSKDYDVITAYYSIQDGKAVLSSMVDRYMVDFPNKRRLNTALIYPSEYLERYTREMDEKVRLMLKQIGIENGTLFLEGCVNETGFYLWEAGYRLCGCQQNVFPAYINGVDVQELLIRHALTGKMADEDQMNREDPSFKGRYACNGILFVRPGKIKNVIGIDRIEHIPGVISFSQLLPQGVTVEESEIGTLNQSVARFHIVADTKEELLTLMKRIVRELSVRDENNNEMLLDLFDYKEMHQSKRWADKRL